MVGEMIADFLRDNPVTRLVGAIVLMATGLQHVLSPGSMNTVQYLLGLVQVAVPDIVIQAIGVGVFLIGLGMAQMIYDMLY